MGRKKGKELNDLPLHDKGCLPENSEEETFSLEEILAEYNRGTEAHAERVVQKVMETSQVGQVLGEPGEKTKPEELAELPELPELTRELLEVLPELSELPKKPRPRPVSVEEVVGKTVESLLAEGEVVQEEQPRRWLFSKRKIEETEEIFPPPEPEPEPPEPEPPLYEVAEIYRRLRKKLSAPFPGALVVTLLLVALMAADYRGVTIPFWTGDLMIQSFGLLAALLVVCILGRQVFFRAVRRLGRKKCSPELLVSLSCVVTALDCATRPYFDGRCEVLPFAAVSCAAVCFSMWGGKKEAEGLYDAYRTAAVHDRPPWLVTDTAHGACKQKGSSEGFFRMAESDSLYASQMAVFLPVILTATVVFAILSSAGNKEDFLWSWSALLAASAGFALPLSYSVAFSKLSRKLQKSGAAIAGYAGAERVCRKKAVVLTDTDLFPPGTITLNGMKLYAETLSKVVSYATSLALESGSGLVRLFEGLMQSEGGHAEKVDDFSFYEEGGVSGTIHGESVLLGTLSFMRKMDIRLPGGITLKTGVFLAVDGQLVAVFAVKYLISDNVAWALKSIRRGRILPILAMRDGNITPELIKRKFGTKGKLAFPDLSSRLALSELKESTGRPDALLFREGLMPYAEVVTGSRRYSKAARRSVVLSLLGSVMGTLLAFYLTMSAAYSLLTPLAMLVFLLLWTLPVFLLAGWVRL